MHTPWNKQPNYISATAWTCLTKIPTIIVAPKGTIAYTISTCTYTLIATAN